MRIMTLYSLTDYCLNVFVIATDYSLKSKLFSKISILILCITRIAHLKRVKMHYALMMSHELVLVADDKKDTSVSPKWSV